MEHISCCNATKFPSSFTKQSKYIDMSVGMQKLQTLNLWNPFKILNLSKQVIDSNTRIFEIHRGNFRRIFKRINVKVRDN